MTTEYKPFTAAFSFKVDPNGIHCYLKAEATASEMYEATCAMISGSIGAMERTSAFKGVDFSQRLKAMRAAYAALREYQEARMVADRTIFVGKAPERLSDSPMTTPPSGTAHEALVEKVAREAEAKMFAPHELARAVIALIAEETKKATDEMEDGVNAYSPTSVWAKMHRASALWPKESK